MNRPPKAILNNERGVALAFVALLLFVLLGLAALAIDIGMLYGSRTEAQRSADAAALAGASVLLRSGQDEAGARATAIDYAARNSVRREAPEVLPGDVDVDLSDGLVRVRVIRSEDRGTPVPNVFARAIGFPTSDVRAVGAARAGMANAVRCPLPFALVDRFWKGSPEDRMSRFDDSFIRPPDSYVAGSRSATVPQEGDRTGWGELDFGTPWRIYPGQNNQAPTPGYYYPVSLDQTGGDPYRDWIVGCRSPDRTFALGQELLIEPGRMVGPTNQGFSELLATDETFWDGTGPTACPRDPATGECNWSTRRIRPMIMISPLEPALSQSGRQTVRIANLAGVYVVCLGRVTAQTLAAGGPRRKSDCTGNVNANDAGVWVRFVRIEAEIVAGGGPPDSNSLLRSLRLVE